MELVMTRNRRGEDKTLKCYRVGSYEVSHLIYDSGWEDIQIRADRTQRYQPEIYSRCNWETGKILEFHIQTTSYGALPLEEIRKVMEGYEEAIKVVEILNKEFVKEDQK